MGIRKRLASLFRLMGGAFCSAKWKAHQISYLPSLLKLRMDKPGSLFLLMAQLI